MKRNFMLIFFMLFMFVNGNSQAGQYSDDMSKCFVESSSARDKIQLVRWMVLAMSLHPAVEPMTSISKTQYNDTNKKTAELFQRLLVESCAVESRKAIKYEGEMGFLIAFKTLGEVAARELFTNPKVAGGMADLEKYFDAEKLEKILGEN